MNEDRTGRSCPRSCASCCSTGLHYTHPHTDLQGHQVSKIWWRELGTKLFHLSPRRPPPVILFHLAAQDVEPTESHPPLTHTAIRCHLHKLRLCPCLRDTEALRALRAKDREREREGVGARERESCSVLQSGIPLGCERECKSQQKRGGEYGIR